MSPSDPFVKEMTASQFFEVQTDKDNTVEGQKGSIIAIPKGCFLDESGNVIDKPVKIEFTEALGMADMVLSNLTTSSDGKLLESGGMIYFHAMTKDGKAVKINPAKPVYIEVPTANRKAGMQLYSGTRDKNGNMNWVDPKPLQNYLIPVNADLLDFYPEGFEEAVQKHLPYKNHKVLTKELTDSLYYSFSMSMQGYPVAAPAKVEERKVDIREPAQYENIVTKRGGRKYTDSVGTGKILMPKDSSRRLGIDPAIIKTIRSPKYAGTLLSTREFEKRLKFIFSTCRQDLLDIYIKNIDRNLWEIDEMAAKKFSSNSYNNPFLDFAKEKLTNVKDAGAIAAQLQGYYESHLRDVKNKLEKVYRQAQKKREVEKEKFEKVAEEYQQILVKRENYRMPKYGFTMTDQGWKNIDTGLAEKPWKYSSLEVTIKSTDNFDRSYSYIILNPLRSLYGMIKSEDNEKVFTTQFQGSAQMPMPKDECIAIVVAYKGEDVYFVKKNFIAEKGKKLSLSPEKISKEDLKKELGSFNLDGKINSVKVDLKYQELIYKENKKREEETREAEMLDELYHIINLCCDENFTPDAKIQIGKQIYSSMCTACHKFGGVLIGPDLTDVEKRWPSREKLKAFIRDPASFIDKDPYIKSLQEEANGSVMSIPTLSDCQVDAILDYIKDETQESQVN